MLLLRGQLADRWDGESPTREPERDVRDERAVCWSQVSAVVRFAAAVVVPRTGYTRDGLVTV